MRIAAHVRQEKDDHPERFCPDKRCLWRISTQRGEFKPCPKHMRPSASVNGPEVESKHTGGA